MSEQLELDDIQGDILKAYGNAYDCTAYVFVHVDHAGRGQAWLTTLLARLSTAAPWTGGKPDCHTNVALTAAGLRALGVSDRQVATFAPEFLDGMSARAPLLGDVGASAPEHWHADFDEAHVLVTLNTRDPEQMATEMAGLHHGLATHGLPVVYEQQAALLHTAREHFGYADGFAQPAVAGAADYRAPGGGIPVKGGKWRPLAAGEFILGYHDEDTRSDPKRGLPPAPAAPLGQNGTYMVWRKLYQDVALWRCTLKAAAARYAEGDEVKLAAKVVGRWPNGTPVVTHPDAPDPSFEPFAEGANDFRFAGDGDGMRCPLGAHIRRSNPRDALDPDGHQSFRHRMIRRGMPYGPPLPEGETDDDGVDRGLCFVSFHASIARQFEGVQVPWLNDGNIFRQGHDTDFLLGDVTGRGGKMTIPGKVPFFLGPQGSFVLTKGGAYLFVPGRRALAAIAEGRAG